MKKNFETPDVEVILLAAQDVIRTSIPTETEDDPNGGWGGIF
jgi:hypothetical protein